MSAGHSYTCFKHFSKCPILCRFLLECNLSWEDRNKINKLIRKAGSIIGLTPDLLEMIMEQSMGRKLKIIMQNEDHPMYYVSCELKSSFSNRLVIPRCSSERFRKSFVPAAVKFWTFQWTLLLTVTVDDDDDDLMLMTRMVDVLWIMVMLASMNMLISYLTTNIWVWSYWCLHY